MTAKTRRLIIGMIASITLLITLLLPQFTNATTTVPFNLDGLKISPCDPGNGSGGGRPGGKLVKSIQTDIL